MATRPRKLPRRSSLRLLLLAGALLAGAGTALVAWRGSDRYVAPVHTAEEQNTSLLLPAPARAVAKGESLGGIPLTQVKWPKGRASSGFVSDSNQLKNTFALTPLPPLLPVPAAAITDSPVDGNAVVEAIPEGMRAITVKVDAESAVEGWARSGNFVDVILVRAAEGGALESTVIAENVRILSAGNSAVPLEASQTAPKAPSTVTLLVDQEAALRIKTAVNLGRLTFALRGSGDKSPTIAVSIDQRRLFGAGDTIQKKEPFKGRAKGPDGKWYVLGKDATWMRASDSVADPSPSGGQ